MNCGVRILTPAASLIRRAHTRPKRALPADYLLEQGNACAAAEIAVLGREAATVEGRVDVN